METAKPNWKTLRDAAIAEALNLEYTDERKFVEVVSMEFALSNMGQDLASCLTGYGMSPPRADVLIRRAYDSISQSEGDEIYEAFEEERGGWVKEAKKMVVALKKAGLPLTVANTHLFWEKKGPFAK